MCWSAREPVTPMRELPRETAHQQPLTHTHIDPPLHRKVLLMSATMRHNKRVPNPPRRCIFCDGVPISREHVWAEWMRPYLPAGDGAQLIHESRLDNDLIRTRPGPLHRKGDARSQKLKVVCVPCNTGWMSVIQNQTKPVLLPLLLKRRKVLTQQKQKALATWATMFAMIYETTVPDYAATSAVQRTAFKARQEPPEYWSFWCAPFDGLSSPAIQTGFASQDRGPKVGSDTAEAHKASLTLCGAGGIAFAVLGVSSKDGYEAFTQFITVLVERAGFVQLWPTTKLPIRITDRRTSALGFRDFWTVRDAIYASLRQAVSLRR